MELTSTFEVLQYITTVVAILIVVSVVLFVLLHCFPIYKELKIAWKYLNSKVYSHTKEVQGCVGFTSHLSRPTFWKLYRDILFTTTQLLILYEDLPNQKKKTVKSICIIKHNIIYNGERSNNSLVEHLLFPLDSIEVKETSLPDTDEILHCMRLLERDIFLEYPNSILIITIHKNNPFVDILEDAEYKLIPVIAENREMLKYVKYKN